MRAAEMPPYSAAFLFWPTVVTLKPIVVRPTNHQMTMATMTPRKNPIGKSKTRGISAVEWITGVREMAPPSGSWNGPRAPTIHSVRLIRMALSMIVVITSWAPR